MKKTLTTLALCFLAASAAVLSSCNKDNNYSPVPPQANVADKYSDAPLTKATINYEGGSSATETVNSCQVFAYDASSGELVSYAESASGLVSSITVPCISCNIHVLANCALIANPSSSVPSESSFLAQKALLAQMKGQPMYGKLAANITGAASLSVSLIHLTSKVVITSACKKFTNTSDQREMSLNSIYIANAAQSVMVNGAVDSDASLLYTSGITAQTGLSKDYLVKQYTSTVLSATPKNIGASFFPLPCAQSKIIFACSIGSGTYYYTVALPATLKANQLVEISNVTFTKQGAKTPGAAVPDDASITVTITVKDWEKDGNITWSETVTF